MEPTTIIPTNILPEARSLSGLYIGTRVIRAMTASVALLQNSPWKIAGKDGAKNIEFGIVAQVDPCLGCLVSWERPGVKHHLVDWFHPVGLRPYVHAIPKDGVTTGMECFLVSSLPSVGKFALVPKLPVQGEPMFRFEELDKLFDSLFPMKGLPLTVSDWEQWEEVLTVAGWTLEGWDEALGQRLDRLLNPQGL